MPFSKESLETFVASVNGPNPPDRPTLIFYASWCPDCHAVDDAVNEKFKAEGGPTALIVEVGDKPTWKSPENKYRKEPYNIQSIPTVVKLVNGKEAGRLVEEDITPQNLTRLYEE